MWFEKHSRIHQIHQQRVIGEGKKVKKLEEQCKNMEEELQEFHNNQIDPEYVYNKLVDLEDSSRRYNLRINVVTEKKGEI